jgi:hypothetical protein
MRLSIVALAILAVCSCSSSESSPDASPGAGFDSGLPHPADAAASTPADVGNAGPQDASVAIAPDASPPPPDAATLPPDAAIPPPDASVAQGPCSTGGAAITSLPACTGPGSTSAVDVPAGCTPTVDGTLHLEEWNDAACFTVSGGDMVVRIKYSGDSVYMATSGLPTCGCPMPFEFDPDGSGAANDNEFDVSVFDDPFGTDGDRGNWILQNGAFVQSTVPAGILVMCPPNPSPVRYEWKIPFAALGITAGTAHTWRLAIIHASAHWPDGLAVNTEDVSVDPTNWGQMSSSSDWK